VTGAERAAIGHIPVGRGILGVLIDDARPLRLHDIAEDPRSVGLPPNHPPMGSFLGVPVKAGGRVYGNLYMTEKAGGEDFDADDERALSLLAAQAGAAIEAANLFEQANDRAQRLEAIRAVSTAILAGTDTGELLGLIVRHARALAGTDMAAVAVPVDGERLAVEAADGLLAGQLLGTVFPAEGSVTGDVIRTGKAVVLADAGADPRVAQPIVAAGAGPAVFIPLAVRGRILGTLTVANGRGGPLLRDSEVQLVETFAEQAAVALEYGRLQGQLQRLAVLEVDDDGRGFDPAAATGAGQGLRNLRERAEGLGGRAEIDSSPGQGTRVRVTIPR
jgi:GAF domain-containing protein